MIENLLEVYVKREYNLSEGYYSVLRKVFAVVADDKKRVLGHIRAYQKR